MFPINVDGNPHLALGRSVHPAERKPPDGARRSARLLARVFNAPLAILAITMATATKVLDRVKFEARARIIDLFALGLLIVAGFSLMVDMYYLGATAKAAASAGGDLVYVRDARFVRMLLQAGLFTVSFAWVAYRLLAQGARRIGG